MDLLLYSTTAKKANHSPVGFGSSPLRARKISASALLQHLLVQECEILRMAKMSILRSLCRSISSRSYTVGAASQNILHHHRNNATRSFFNSSFHLHSVPNSSLPRRLPHGITTMRFFSSDLSHLPVLEDPDLDNVFKDLMSGSWDNLPEPVIYEAKTALSKNTEDKAGKEIVENVFRAAQAVEEFSGILDNIKMEIDDIIGLSGENVQPLSDELTNALQTVFHRYISYLDSFGPKESYLKKKVETELGTKIIHLKMRCGGLGSEWGKVAVLGTSGLSGSYIEHRA